MGNWAQENYLFSFPLFFFFFAQVLPKYSQVRRIKAHILLLLLLLLNKTQVEKVKEKSHIIKYTRNTARLARLQFLLEGNDQWMGIWGRDKELGSKVSLLPYLVVKAVVA